jgi:hypothetical protein
MSFLLWKSKYLEGFCVVTAPAGIDKVYELNQGVSRADGFPADAACEMNSDFPKDIQLSDNLYGAGFAVVSNRLKEELEQQRVNNVEFLPIKIINHKGRIAAKDYFIVNPLDVCDCIDIDKSGVKWNSIAPDKISRCQSLVLRPDQVPPEFQIFRLKFWPNLIAVRSALADRLTSAGFSGLCFRNTETFKGI